MATRWQVIGPKFHGRPFEQWFSFNYGKIGIQADCKMGKWLTGMFGSRLALRWTSLQSQLLIGILVIALDGFLVKQELKQSGLDKIFN